MSDRYGLLQLPMAEPFGDPETDAIGDPALDVLASFLKTAVNADTKAGWAVVHPAIVPPATEAVPIVHARTHNPDDVFFRENELPAIFVWRASFPKSVGYTQDWESQLSHVAVLWVPPANRIEFARQQHPFRNAIAKSIHRVVKRRRHPAWVVAGDTGSDVAERGSVITKQLNAQTLQVIDVKPYPLRLERGKSNDDYDCLLVTLELVELCTPVGDEYDEVSGLQSNFVIGTPPLVFATAEFRPVVTGVAPSSGASGGGTTIVVSGSQFSDELGPIQVLVGNAACTDVNLVDPSTLVATTPPGAAGAASVTVVLPNGTSASLASAFTYV
jgi:hypothetical protein